MFRVVIAKQTLRGISMKSNSLCNISNSAHNVSYSSKATDKKQKLCPTISIWGGSLRTSSNSDHRTSKNETDLLDRLQSGLPSAGSWLPFIVKKCWLHP